MQMCNIFYNKQHITRNDVSIAAPNWITFAMTITHGDIQRKISQSQYSKIDIPKARFLWESWTLERGPLHLGRDIEGQVVGWLNQYGWWLTPKIVFAVLSTCPFLTEGRHDQFLRFPTKYPPTSIRRDRCDYKLMWCLLAPWSWHVVKACLGEVAEFFCDKLYHQLEKWLLKLHVGAQWQLAMEGLSLWRSGWLRRGFQIGCGNSRTTFGRRSDQQGLTVLTVSTCKWS